MRSTIKTLLLFLVACEVSLVVQASGGVFFTVKGVRHCYRQTKHEQKRRAAALPALQAAPNATSPPIVTATGCVPTPPPPTPPSASYDVLHDQTSPLALFRPPIA